MSSTSQSNVVVLDEPITKPTAVVWNKAPAQPAVIYSLEDVMSEQLAHELSQKEAQKKIDAAAGIISNNDDDALQLTADELKFISADNQPVSNSTTEDTDFMLAQLLQLELDKEYDMVLKQHENLRNKNSSVTVSYDKFKSVHPLTGKDEQEIDELNADELSSSSSESDDEEKLENMTFKRGVRGKGENMISKHDLELTAKHNGSKVMNFPPEFETGDGHNFEFRLSNKVFNQLKLHSFSSGRKARLHDKQERSTAEMALDPKTRLILYKFVNADILDSIGGIISTGKEATILYASGGQSQEILVPRECVCKVFKTTLNEFKTREKYIAEDYRFKDRFKHLNPQKIIKLWAEKEMHNLMKMRRFEIPCPDVILLKKHVLLMSFIGKDNVPAPKLKDAILDAEQMLDAYNQCFQIMYDLYHKCNLVHADFNQFNLLWHENRVWVIDVSQSVEPISPMGLEFLFRDCKNLHRFFVSKLDASIPTSEEMFSQITNIHFDGNNFEGDAFLSQIQKYTKDKQMEMNALLNRDAAKEYNFDYFFDKTSAAKNVNTTTAASAVADNENND